MSLRHYPYRRRVRRYTSPYALRRRAYGADPRAVAVAAGVVAVVAWVHAHPGTGPAVGGGVAAAGLGGTHAPAKARPKPAHASRAAQIAVAYAESRIGRVPYVWGGTTDAGMDCSGLVMEAYASAGISLQRTSQMQWATEHHVTTAAVGDLVFFAGSDGTPWAPGHVGIVVDPARHLMVDAYATGYDVAYDTYGLASSRPGNSPAIGFTDPGAS